MSSRQTCVVFVSMLLPLLPLTTWMHLQAGQVVSPTVDAIVVDVRLTRQVSPAGEHGAPPRESVDVLSTAEYSVDGQVYQRQLWPRSVRLGHDEDLQAFKHHLLGSTVVLEFDPLSPGNRPPIDWKWWTAWLLTAASLGCLMPLLKYGLQRLFDRINQPGQATGRRRVLSGDEYRASQQQANTVR